MFPTRDKKEMNQEGTNGCRTVKKPAVTGTIPAGCHTAVSSFRILPDRIISFLSLGSDPAGWWQLTSGRERCSPPEQRFCCRGKQYP